MLAIREEELNMVNGGTANNEMLGGPKFNEGDWVTSKSQSYLGVGLVYSRRYDEGWKYNVFIGGSLVEFPESDLEISFP